jgi:hypothetical protein
MATSNKPTRAMLAAIGEVAAESAAVDEKLRDVFGLLMESPYARVIVAGEDTARLTQMCLRVAAYNTSLTDLAVERLQAICSVLDQLRSNRNQLVHSAWFKADGPGQHVGIRSRRPAASGETSDALQWTPKTAIEIAEHYRTVSAGIDQFLEESFDRPPYPALMTRKRNAQIMAWFREHFPRWFESFEPDPKTSG